MIIAITKLHYKNLVYPFNACVKMLLHDALVGLLFYYPNATYVCHLWFSACRDISVYYQLLHALLIHSVEMSMVNTMYQTSLTQFLGIFDESMAKSHKSPITAKRIHNIIEYLTYAAFRYVHKFVRLFQWLSNEIKS